MKANIEPIKVGKGAVINPAVPMAAFLLCALVAAGCAGYKNVKNIHQLPADRSAAIRIVVNTTSEGKLLQEEIEKDYWRLPSGPYPAYPVYTYEWFLWLAIDREIHPLIPKDRTLINNVPLIHEGATASLTRAYTVPPGLHTYWLEFAGMRPYVYSRGSGGGAFSAISGREDDDGDDDFETRLGFIRKSCFTADLQPGRVITVKIDDEGIHLPKEVKAEHAARCKGWLLGPPVETFKRNLP